MDTSFIGIILIIAGGLLTGHLAHKYEAPLLLMMLPVALSMIGVMLQN